MGCQLPVSMRCVTVMRRGLAALYGTLAVPPSAVPYTEYDATAREVARREASSARRSQAGRRPPSA